MTKFSKEEFDKWTGKTVQGFEAKSSILGYAWAACLERFINLRRTEDWMDSDHGRSQLPVGISP
jgi:hypothetical protein